jgi:hypothetical protein
MKKYFVLMIAMFLALNVVTLSAQAPAGADGPDSYTSGFQIQNLENTPGTLNITFYNKDGSEGGTVSEAIAANGANNYYPIAAVSDGFDGSAVISSDVSVVAIVNVFGNGGAFGGGAYDGFSAGGQTVNIPLVIKNVNNPGGFKINTYFNVQNAGSSEATVNVTYPGTACTDSDVIKVGASAMFDQAATACLPDGFVGSASVTSNVDVVASVIQYDNKSLLANNGFTSADESTNPVMPLVINNFVDTFTGIQIQNVGTTATDVTLTYTPSPGNPGATCTETLSINQGESANFGINYITDNCEAAGTAGFVGSAVVTANSASQNLVAIVNQVNLLGAGSNPGNGSAYAAFSPDSATNSVAMPVIVEDLSLGAAGNLFTGFNIYNAGASAVDVTCDYIGKVGGTDVSASTTINVPNGIAVNVTNTGPGGFDPGFVGSATCAGPAGSKLVAVVNQVGGAGDSIFTYEGFAK